MAEVGAIQLCIDHALDEGSSDDAEGGAFQLAALLARLSAAEQQRDKAQDEAWENWSSYKAAEVRADAAEKALREIAELAGYESYGAHPAPRIARLALESSKP